MERIQTNYLLDVGTPPRVGEEYRHAMAASAVIVQSSRGLIIHAVKKMAKGTSDHSPPDMTACINDIVTPL